LVVQAGWRCCASFELAIWNHQTHEAVTKRARATFCAEKYVRRPLGLGLLACSRSADRAADALGKRTAQPLLHEGGASCWI
jgi:hypothetical protein